MTVAFSRVLLTTVTRAQERHGDGALFADPGHGGEVFFLVNLHLHDVALAQDILRGGGYGGGQFRRRFRRRDAWRRRGVLGLSERGSSQERGEGGWEEFHCHGFQSKVRQPLDHRRQESWTPIKLL